jgi:hypothetical protein
VEYYLLVVCNSECKFTVRLSGPLALETPALQNTVEEYQAVLLKVDAKGIETEVVMMSEICTPRLYVHLASDLST